MQFRAVCRAMFVAGQRARRCATLRESVYTRANVRRPAASPLAGSFVALTDTRTLNTHIYTRAPQTRTYVHTRSPRHGLKGRDPNHFPKLLVDGGRVTRRLTFHCRPRAAPSRAAARRTGKKLKTQLAGLSIGRRFDSDLTCRRMFRCQRLIATV